MIKVAGIKGCTKSVKSIAEGIVACGDTYQFDNLNTDIVNNADAYLQTNLLKPKYATKDRSGAYEYVLDSGKPFLVNESANFRKYYQNYCRLGWYSYKWTEGIFGNEKSPPDRWNKFKKETGLKIKHWHSPGDDIIIMGQKEGDSSLTDLYDAGYKHFTQWMQETVDKIRKHSDRKIIIRPHPGDKRSYTYMKDIEKRYAFDKSVRISYNRDLRLDLQNAYAVVNHNSSSIVGPIIQGYHAFITDAEKSQCAQVAHLGFERLENPIIMNRQKWLERISMFHWKFSELEDGSAWSHMRNYVVQ